MEASIVASIVVPRLDSTRVHRVQFLPGDVDFVEQLSDELLDLVVTGPNAPSVPRIGCQSTTGMLGE